MNVPTERITHDQLPTPDASPSFGLRTRRRTRLGAHHHDDRGARRRLVGARRTGTIQRFRSSHFPRLELLDDRGSATVEFTLVSVLLTALVLAVLQFGLVIYVRNSLVDAAAEGARWAALADNHVEAGRSRTEDIIREALGSRYFDDIRVQSDPFRVTVFIRTTLPLIGLLGVERGMEVSGHAVREVLRRQTM